MRPRSGTSRWVRSPALTGISIRTLHHYDDAGLLRPSRRLASGRRLYSSADVLKLQQILTLRYLGFPLRQIRELLQRSDFDVVASVRIQRQVVRDRIAELDRIDASLRQLIDRRLATGEWDWQGVSEASAAVGRALHQKGAAMDDYYTPEQIRQHASGLARGPRGQELRELEGEWRALIRDMHAQTELSPETPKARELATRWESIRERARSLFQGDEKLWQSLGRAHLDGQYDNIEEAAHAADYAFIRRVDEAAVEGP
jgi:MerR family transcriptional regulator, thiopeptide resistance regulator